MIPPLAFNANMVGPVIANFGDAGDEGEVPRQDGEPRHLVVPGLLRAQRRLRPRVADHKAVRDDDEWVINGQKTWTTLGQHADWIFVLCRTDPEVKKQAGISISWCRWTPRA